MLSEERKKEVLDLTRRLIGCESYSGYEKGIVDILTEYMKAHGFEDISTDKYGNLTAFIKGSRPGRTVLFDGHIDTVPVIRSGWTKNPLGELEDDRL